MMKKYSRAFDDDRINGEKMNENRRVYDLIIVRLLNQLTAMVMEPNCFENVPLTN